MIGLYFILLLVAMGSMSALSERLIRQKMRGPAKWMLLGMIFLLPVVWLSMRVGLAVHFKVVFGAPWWVPGTELLVMLTYLLMTVWISRRVNPPDNWLGRRVNPPDNWLGRRATALFALTGVIGLIGSIGLWTLAVQIGRIKAGSPDYAPDFDWTLLAPPTVPDADNSRPLYLAFHDAYLTHLREGDIEVLYSRGLHDPEFLAAFKAHEPRLEIVRQAADKPAFSTNKHPNNVRLFDRRPEISAFRAAVWLLTIAADVQASQGDMPSAIADLQRAYRVVQHNRSSHTSLDFVSSIVNQDIANKAYIKLLPRISTARELQAIAPPSIDWDADARTATQCDLYLTQQSIAGYAVNGGDEIRYTARDSIWLPEILLCNQQRGRQVTQLILDRLAMPYPQLAGMPVPSGTRIMKEHGYLFAIYGPLILSPIKALRNIQASDRALTIAIAARRYQLDHGTNPSASSDLVPGYLSVWPVDPFSPKDPMLMIARPDGSLAIYSLGENLSDDGGDVHNDPSRLTPGPDAGLLLAPGVKP